MLRVDVDVRMLEAGGIGRYIREIVGPWLTKGAVAAARLYGAPGPIEAWLRQIEPATVVDVVAWTDPIYSVRAQARWPRLNERRSAWQADVSLFPHFNAPLVAHPRPSVVVVHDLIHLRIPDAFPWWKRWLAATMIKSVATQTDHIVTVSEHSKADILDFIGAEAPPVAVIRNGVSDVFTPAPGPAPTSDPFILVVAPHKPHKNLKLAVQILDRLPRHEGWRLVAVGPDADDRSDLVRQAGSSVTAELIEVPGAVDDFELRKLYRQATVVLIPSLLEGFALPALEARACGTRALAPDVPWGRELTDAGVELVQGWDPDSWVRVIRTPATQRPDSEVPPHSIPRWSDASTATLDVVQGVAERSPLGRRG